MREQQEPFRKKLQTCNVALASCELEHQSIVNSTLAIKRSRSDGRGQGETCRTLTMRVHRSGGEGSRPFA